MTKGGGISGAVLAICSAVAFIMGVCTGLAVCAVVNGR